MNTDNRRNSFSAFVKNLFLLVTPTNQTNDNKLERKMSANSSENSPFQDLYFSFPAFDESEESSTSTCSSTSSYTMANESNRIMC
ncbi:hypothetical protein BD560DRAFT_389949 [Blakeslea trispora]|nr:hypothetical protein BD560DRAFT_389949 [Blakeslea trispora]